MQLSVKLILGGAAMLGATVLVGFLGFQPLVNVVVKDQTSLRKRNQMRKLYLNIPFPLDTRIYFFNVTNPMEVQNGSKPILQEVGPYCYDEHKNKINVVDNDAEDSLRYDAFDVYRFNKNRSGNLSDEDYVTIIHPLLVGMVNRVASDSPALLSILNQAFETIFKNPQSIYLTDKVKNILFDGMELNCEGADFAAKAVCTQLKSLVPGIKEKPTNKNVLLYSLIGPRNATVASTIKVLRGTRNYKDIGRVLEVDGKKQITLWGSDFCNRFRGTDGWIIPPLLDPADGIQSYTPHLCRNIDLKFVKDDVIKKIQVRRYETTLGDQTNNTLDKCYCSPKRCLKKGVFDLTKCVGAPIMATLPHFLETDQSYLSQVDGLHPNWEDHILNINIEPMTSAPLSVKIRIQMNLEIGPQPKISVMKNLPVALHPIFWLEDGLELEGELYEKIANIFVLLKMAQILRWTFIVVSIAIIAYGYYLIMKNRKSVKITPVHSASSYDSYDNEAFNNRSTNAIISQLKTEMNYPKNYRNVSNNNTNNNNVGSGHEFDRYS
ncbi:unnamed protein product [Phyllotreta striolata]|uniref:Sensory neuron membrane protein 1 n=1 Tax=Phyllotreta striolata TaxID=444603 RepID=A0A9N9TVW3_PHYSR|nr:unnamed protein product [Phyllotreta striolata]